jgi:hypothetical protein
MTSLSEGRYAGEFLVSEAPGSRSRENVTVLSGQNLVAGAVVGRRLVGATFGAAAALNTNTGNGTVNAPAVGTNLGARRGTYRIVIVEPAANLGTFVVYGPDGKVVGDGVVATEFDNEIKFTVADGATDFISGDAFTIEVSAGTYKYKEYNPANVDGSQRPAGVLYAAVDASAADAAGVVIARDAEIHTGEIAWFAGATTAQKNIALDLLAEQLGIVGRA